ncbi:MAG: phenylacetate--CoA ligase family protein [Anaerolineaceae bacterium]|nr:MAG: hypothetical protein CVU46_07030 [Chloroflexi bacterium HGW-Chloroflexi-8]
MNSTLSQTALKLHEKLTHRRILVRLEELNHTQWLSRNDLLALQRKKLQDIVEYAYQYVPYYRRIFDEVAFRPEEFSQNPESFSKLPILTKSIIKENWNDLLSTDPVRREQMSKLATSGSTGQPLVFMQDSDFRDSVTADIQRHMGWAGWKLGDLHAMIWGAPQNPPLSRRVRLKLINWIWNRFQINAFALTDETMIAFAERVSRKSPQILFGYATSLYHFAQFVRQSTFKDISFRGIFSTSELLLPNVRQYIEETFHCKVFDRYGTLELGGIACECETHTGLHTSMENNVVEILSNGSPAQLGEVGDIIVTNLNNKGMPFLRYSIGDAGAWYAGENCSCGRESLMLEKIEGRLVDSFYTRDGRKVWSGFAGAGFRCLTHPAITQFQVVQKSLDRMIVRLVLNGELPKSVEEEIKMACKSAYGENVIAELEFVDEIPPLPSGKHQYAVSELNHFHP